jgi:hypothetical protein
MVAWLWSSITEGNLLKLVEEGSLPPLTDVLEWIIHVDNDFPWPGDGYVVSFT